MKFDTIPNENLVDTIIKRIKDSIISGELKPGDKIPTEVELIQQLGVGRNSVREAIKMLTAMGILEIRRGSGTYVASKINPEIFNPLIFSLILEGKNTNDIYQLRTAFESGVLYIAIKVLKEEDIDKLDKFLDDLQNDYDNNNNDIDYFVKADLKFHNEILKAINNPLLEHLGNAINEIFPYYIRKSIWQENGVLRSINNHRKILEIIRLKQIENIFSIEENSLNEWREAWK